MIGRANPLGLFPAYRTPGGSAGVTFSSPAKAYATAIVRLVEAVRLRDLVDPRQRAELDAKIVATVTALARARASGQHFVVPCAEADMLVNVVAMRCAPAPDPKDDDRISIEDAVKLSDRTPRNDPAYDVSIRQIEEGAEDHERQQA